MAGGDELAGLGGSNGALAAMLLVGAGTNVYDAYSAVMSSPWSTEKFTNDPQEEKMAREYVMHAMIISGTYAGAGALLAYKSGGIALAIWPILGAAGVGIYMYWLYNRALCRSRTTDGMSAQAPGAAPAAGDNAAWSLGLNG